LSKRLALTALSRRRSLRGGHGSPFGGFAGGSRRPRA
jgi:hypothetical protein